MTVDRRYTGTYYEDGHTDCSADLTACQYEEDTECWHCGTPVREHWDEDGTPIKTEPR